MRRRAHPLFCAAGVLGLAIFGFVLPSGPAFAEDLSQFLGRKAREIAQAAAQLLQFEQQFGPQFRQLYRSELHFMRAVCQPTKQQYEKIAADGEPGLKAAIHKFAQAMHRPLPPDQQSDPRVLMIDGIKKSVRTRLSPEQADQYEKELAQRAAAQKRVVLLNLVAKMDKLLVLTTEQRGKVSEILEKNWKDSWDQVQALMYGGQNFPTMPDNEIMPILTENQKTVWRGVPKYEMHFGFGVGFIHGLVLEEEVWDEDRPAGNPAQADGQAADKDKGTTKPVEKK